MTFWIILGIVVFLLLLSSDVAEAILWVIFIIGYIFMLLFGPLFYVDVDLTQYHRESSSACSGRTSPQEELCTNIVFIDSLGRALPGETVCPYIGVNVCPVIPEFISWVNTDVTYRIDAESADVQYSPFYTCEGNGIYKMMSTSIDEGHRNTCPIENLSNLKDSTVIDVTLNAKWSRCFYSGERTLILRSIIHLVPRDDDFTFDQWMFLCDSKLDSMDIVGMTSVTYCSDDLESRVCTVKSSDQFNSSEVRSYNTQELPKVDRAIYLRQDMFKTCKQDSIRITNVEVSSVVGGGVLADVYIEPVDENTRALVLYQYYTKAEDTKDAYKTDYAYVNIYSGQDHFQIFVEEGYDQFALVAISTDLDFWPLRKNDSERLVLMRDVGFYYRAEMLINDYAILYRGDDDCYLLVDHREGFWQKLFYSKYTNDFDWLTTILISITGLGLIALVVWLVIRKFKK